MLLSRPGSARACAAGSPVQPIKGVVRTLSATAKGNFRTIGGAEHDDRDRGSWIVSDRCNGTLTEVGRGKVTVHDTKLKKDFTLRSGQGYLARARLFAARTASYAPRHQDADHVEAVVEDDDVGRGAPVRAGPAPAAAPPAPAPRRRPQRVLQRDAEACRLRTASIIVSAEPASCPSGPRTTPPRAR